MTAAAANSANCAAEANVGLLLSKLVSARTSRGRSTAAQNPANAEKEKPMQVKRLHPDIGCQHPCQQQVTQEGRRRGRG